MFDPIFEEAELDPERWAVVDVPPLNPVNYMSRCTVRVEIKGEDIIKKIEEEKKKRTCQKT